MAQNPIVTITMENGDVIKAELYPEIAPNTVNNFISLINHNFYDGVCFHRVIKGFMLQGGDPDGNGTGGPGYEIKHSVRVCDNDLLNALLCRYQKICLTKKIALHIDIRSKCIDFVTYDDLSVLFGNLMDNAVESAEKTVNPFIELNVFQKRKIT